MIKSSLKSIFTWSFCKICYINYELICYHLLINQYNYNGLSLFDFGAAGQIMPNNSFFNLFYTKIPGFEP